MFPAIIGMCEDPACTRRAVTLAYAWSRGLVPVCRRHILAYRVYPTRNARDSCDPRQQVWQAEDEYACLRFARRSRWRWLAQRRILRDQRLARRGIESRAQRRLAARSDRGRAA